MPPVILLGHEGQLCARYRYADLAIERAIAADPAAVGPVALPLDALASLAGRDQTALTLDPVAPDRTVVRRTDRGIPQAREYEVPLRADRTAWPDDPPAWADVPETLIAALAEATAIAAEDSTR